MPSHQHISAACSICSLQYRFAGGSITWIYVRPHRAAGQKDIGWKAESSLSHHICERYGVLTTLEWLSREVEPDGRPWLLALDTVPGRERAWARIDLLSIDMDRDWESSPILTRHSLNDEHERVGRRFTLHGECE